MALIGKLIKGGLAVKALQVAQRELKKPENQKRINDAVTKLKEPPRSRSHLDAEMSFPGGRGDAAPPRVEPDPGLRIRLW